MLDADGNIIEKHSFSASQRPRNVQQQQHFSGNGAHHIHNLDFNIPNPSTLNPLLINSSQSQQQSRVGLRGVDELTPQRGATFYSDGSFTTATSTQLPADKARGLKAVNKRIQIHDEISAKRQAEAQQRLFSEPPMHHQQTQHHDLNPNLGTFGVGALKNHQA